MSDTLPTREEIAAIVLSEVKTVRANEIAEKLLARLRPMWGQLPQVIQQIESRADNRQRAFDKAADERDALHADLRACAEALAATLKWLPDVAQLLDGWRQDSPSEYWTTWDAEVRATLSRLIRESDAALARPGVREALT